MKNTIEKLTSNLGFYGSCEVEIIWLSDSVENKLINFFTKITFLEGDYEHKCKKPTHINLKKIKNRFTPKHIKYFESLDNIFTLFQRLEEGKEFNLMNIDLELSKDIELQPFFFLPPKGNYYPELGLNTLLYENSSNTGSYIFEFADKRKDKILSHLGEKYENSLPEILEEISEKTEINIANVSERIGNVIFQIPINIFQFFRTKGCDLFINWNKKIIKKNRCNLVFLNDLKNENNSITRVKKLRGNHISFIEKEKLMRVLIKDAKSNISLGMSHNCKVFNAGKPAHITLIRTERNLTGKKEPFGVILSDRKFTKDKFQDLIEKREDEKRKHFLEDNLVFKQYGDKVNKEANPIEDIRNLINRYGQNGVYIWDPYISSDSILKTLFHHRYPSTKRVITSSKCYKRSFFKEHSKTEKEKIAEENETKRVEWFEINRATLNKTKNTYGWALEFRCKVGNHGWNFHDRFIIFPGKKPRVWSLGKSISDGTVDHHILQEVIFPERVLEAFDDLWEKLNHDECKVYPVP